MKICTIIKDYKTKQELVKQGDCEERYTPCSTFKLAIALMGYDKSILVNENEPMFEYNPKIHTRAYNKNQKQNQTPKSWLEYSCIWCSKEILKKLNGQDVAKYLKIFDYGNRNFELGKIFRILSSLKISAEEQINFIENFLSQKFPISEKSYDMLKKIMPMIKVGDWKIYGKTGAAFHSEEEQSGWFVGWAERGSEQIIFAKHIEKMKIDFDGK